MTQTILITGGCGFLGGHLVRAIFDAHPDTKVILMDRRVMLDQITAAMDPRIQVLPGRDITDFGQVVGHFAGVDCVVHLAGLVSFSIRDQEALYRVNVDGTRNVLQACRVHEVSQVVHISSVAALGYRDDEHSPVDESFAFDWKIAEKKRKYYMLSKRAGDDIVHEFRGNGTACTILYPGLMFGPGDFTNAPKLIQAVVKGRMPFAMPGGTNIVDVRDAARGILYAMYKDIPESDILLSGSNLRFTEINAVIAEQLGVRAPRLVLGRGLNGFLYRAALLAEKMSRQRLALTADNIDSAFRFRYFDNSRAKELLGWQPEIPFEQTIADTIEWMKNNGLFTG